MRVAIFSDVHGNLLALEAVLADVEAQGGVDATWFIGDAVALGDDPAGCVATIEQLPGVLKVRGNTDRMTVADSAEVDEEFLDTAATDRDLAARQMAMSRGFSWARGILVKDGGYDWLAEMPVEERLELPDGTRVLLVHAAPGTDDGPGLRESQSDAEVEALLEGAEADLVIVGHTHLPMERTVNGVHVWNLGSVSLPFAGDSRAMWTLLEADESGHTLTRQYARYDIDAMLERFEATHHPTGAVAVQAWKAVAR